MHFICPTYDFGHQRHILAYYNVGDRLECVEMVTNIDDVTNIINSICFCRGASFEGLV